ncbi:hypothetical protein CMI37_32165 [Candidatus Pacearchaeota archaeon]|nr:hypothetical protein [Candidatus Pacearchaeota archaeon]|tara:strand:- start:13 stop:1284 length:1272 start_codon:yes stop_codon:yes gene_type:complete
MATYISNTTANTTWVANTTVITATRLNTENANLYANTAALDTALALSHDGTGYFNPTVGSDVASANALMLGTGNIFDITGTTAITSIGTKGTGYMIWLQFDGVLTLTHHATDLILPDGDITTAAGDIACLYEYAPADWRLVSYNRAAAIAGLIAVADGGTGAATHTDGGLLIGKGTAAFENTGVLADSEMVVGDGTTNPVLESGATLRTSIGVGTSDSPQFTGIELSHATANTLTGSGGDVLIEGTILTKVGKNTIWVPVETMTPATTQPCGSLTLVEAGTNDVDYNVMDFDASSDEYANFNIQMPKSWNLGTVTFQVVWLSTATDTDGIAMGLQGVAVSDNEAIDAAWGTAVVVTDDAQGAAGEVYVTDESTAVTIAGTPANNDLIIFRLFRDTSDGNDDMTEDARVLGVRLFFTTSASEDT